jgi:phage terminase small subunit
MELTNKRHKAFADEYLANGMNARKAYMSVYKSSKKIETIDANASRLLSNDKVKVYVEEKQKELRQKYKVEREKVLEGTYKIALMYDEMLQLANKSHLTSEEESRLTRLSFLLKGSDRNKAIEIINKMEGWNSADKQEITHKGININYLPPKDDSNND